MSFKKLMSAVIAVAMLVSCMGLTVFAEEFVIPGCTVAELDKLSGIEAININKNPLTLDLDFGRVFTASEVFDDELKLSDLYESPVDFEITFNQDVNAKLAGWYAAIDPWTDGKWVALCTDKRDKVEFDDGTVLNE